MKSFLASVAALPLCLLLVAGCAADTGETGDPGSDDLGVADEGQATADALTSQVEDGTAARTTANLRLRDGASTDAGVITTLSRGTSVTIVDGTPKNGFYKVSADGEEGYAHGNYLAVEGGSQNDDDPPSSGNGTPGQPSGESFVSDGTGYYPDSSALEGGFVDRRGAKLRTLQQFLNGSAEYVSVAMDTNAFAYGQKLRIKEFELKYNRVIEFRVVDTGGAFRGKGRSRMDICTANRSASLDATVNGNLHVYIQ